FEKRLHALADHPLVGEARGVGLLGALELFSDKRAKTSFEPKLGVGAKAVQLAQEEGLLVRAVGGDNIGICPPLVINEGEINDMFDMLARALDKTAIWARKEGHLRG
ncbi:aminotransferase class III-fold pyridoxal phosphate-dependent enzyme, partial [Herbaspirillum sp. HC18]